MVSAFMTSPTWLSRKSRRAEKGNQRFARTASHFRVLDPILGSLKISKFKPRTFAHALTDIAEGRQLSHASFNRYHALVSSICAYGVREELLEINPMADGRVQRRTEGRVNLRYLERHEQSQLLAVIKRDCPAKADEVELAILTGMRRGEQFNAKWADWKKKGKRALCHGKDRASRSTDQSSCEPVSLTHEKANEARDDFCNAGKKCQRRGSSPVVRASGEESSARIEVSIP